MTLLTGFRTQMTSRIRKQIFRSVNFLFFFPEIFQQNIFQFSFFCICVCNCAFHEQNDRCNYEVYKSLMSFPITSKVI